MADATVEQFTTSAAYNKTTAIFTPVAYNKPAAISTRHDYASKRCDRNIAADHTTYATLAYLLVADGRL